MTNGFITAEVLKWIITILLGAILAIVAVVLILIICGADPAIFYLK